MSIAELEAFISILYARGVMGQSQFRLRSIWSKSWGIPMVAQIMGRNRFEEIMRYLRFDDKSTRRARLTDDKFAIWYPKYGTGSLTIANRATKPVPM